jgi:hypothetical protein
VYHIVGRFKIQDVEAWKQIIESDKLVHKAAGMHFKQVWKNIDNPVEIFFIFEVEDVNRAKLFLQKAGALDKEKQARGEIPELFFLKLA